MVRITLDVSARRRPHYIRSLLELQAFGFPGRNIKPITPRRSNAGAWTTTNRRSSLDHRIGIQSDSTSLELAHQAVPEAERERSSSQRDPLEIFRNDTWLLQIQSSDAQYTLLIRFEVSPKFQVILPTTRVLASNMAIKSTRKYVYTRTRPRELRDGHFWFVSSSHHIRAKPP
ncbi:hypothetical protein PTI98_012803 [Pleurotus ostreatus]|nr:hypothetical protein PTI98_012803 [Pleurotus ostreatus]